MARLRIDNRQQEGSSATRLVDGRQALLPLLLHPDPHRALFLGLGTGVTATAAAADATLDVDAVELLPEVIAASALFTADGQRNPHLIAADARRFVRTSDRRYDVIVADNFHPARSGSGALYTVEHFRAVRARLAPDGVFCQWLPLHQLDLDTLRSIVGAFMVVYPEGHALLANNSLDTPVLGLIAWNGDAHVDVSRIRQRLSHAGVADLGLDDELALLGSHVAGPAALSRFAGDAPVNTDDRPVVMYRAPHVTYAPDSRPRDRLVALLHALHVEPADVVRPSPLDRRLRAYWTARDRFIEAGRDVRPVADATAMLAQVRGPLLDVLAISPDFRPAYDPLLRMASALASTDAAAARDLMDDLSRVRRERGD